MNLLDGIEFSNKNRGTIHQRRQQILGYSLTGLSVLIAKNAQSQSPAIIFSTSSTTHVNNQAPILNGQQAPLSALASYPGNSTSAVARSSELQLNTTGYSGPFNFEQAMQYKIWYVFHEGGEALLYDSTGGDPDLWTWDDYDNVDEDLTPDGNGFIFLFDMPSLPLDNNVYPWNLFEPGDKAVMKFNFKTVGFSGTQAITSEFNWHTKLVLEAQEDPVPDVTPERYWKGSSDTQAGTGHINMSTSD